MLARPCASSSRGRKPTRSSSPTVLNDFDTFEKLEAWLQQRDQSSTPQPLPSKVSRAYLVWQWFAPRPADPRVRSGDRGSDRLASGRRARISSLFAVIVLESARRSRLAGHYRCASVPRDAPRVLSHEPACVQRGPRRPKLQGGLPRTLCNVQAVVNASAKGSASSDTPCSPCACAPWMTRKHSKRAHTNSRRSRSRHEEITGLQVMLGRMFALKVQCDLPEGFAVVLRRCRWTSGRRRRQQRCGVHIVSPSGHPPNRSRRRLRQPSRGAVGSKGRGGHRHRGREQARGGPGKDATCSSTPSMKGARESDIRQGNVPRMVQSRVATAGADANRGVWTRLEYLLIAWIVVAKPHCSMQWGQALCPQRRRSWLQGQV